MRFIPTHVHAVADYLMGVVLIAAPWLFAFAAPRGIEAWVFVAVGVGVILYSLVTDYELGLVPRIPMRAHLALDGIAGALLAVSPWLLGFAWLVLWPHVIFGLLVIGAALTTRTTRERPQAAVEGRRERREGRI